MTEIKTLAEISECCAVCETFRHDRDYGEICLKNEAEDAILDIGWCEGFAPAQWVIRDGIKLIKPKLQGETDD